MKRQKIPIISESYNNLQIEVNSLNAQSTENLKQIIYKHLDQTQLPFTEIKHWKNWREKNRETQKQRVVRGEALKLNKLTNNLHSKAEKVGRSREMKGNSLKPNWEEVEYVPLSNNRVFLIDLYERETGKRD